MKPIFFRLALCFLLLLGGCKSLLEKGNEQFLSGQYQLAIGTFNQILAKDSSNLRARQVLAESYRLSNRIEASLPHYEALVAVEPTFESYFHLGQSHKANEQVEAAKKDMRKHLIGIYDKFKKPIIVTEFGADTIAGFHSLPAEQWSEDYQTELLMGLIEVMREFDFVIGEHVWNFADFRTAQNHSRVGGNKKGVFTRDRQPKMVAHFLKKKWAEPRYTKSA